MMLYVYSFGLLHGSNICENDIPFCLGCDVLSVSGVLS